MEKNCLTCLHWKPKENKPMAAQRFAMCDLGARWAFYPPQHWCESHKLAGADVIAARVEWNKRERNE